MKTNTLTVVFLGVVLLVNCHEDNNSSEGMSSSTTRVDVSDELPCEVTQYQSTREPMVLQYKYDEANCILEERILSGSTPIKRLNECMNGQITSTSIDFDDNGIINGITRFTLNEHGDVIREVLIYCYDDELGCEGETETVCSEEHTYVYDDEKRVVSNKTDIDCDGVFDTDQIFEFSPSRLDKKNVDYVDGAPPTNSDGSIKPVLTQTFIYDANGRVVERFVDDEADGQDDVARRYQYDERGSVIYESFWLIDNGKETLAGEDTYNIVYDELGRYIEKHRVEEEGLTLKETRKYTCD